MPDNRFGGGGPFDGGRRPHNGSNGARPTGMSARPVPFDELSDPVDLVAVQADDELINALSAGMSVSSPGVTGYDADDRVAAILAAWKADVDAEPIPELVDLDTAVATVVAARPPSSRARHLAPVAAAAAFLVLAIGGVSVTSYNAEPDDALWAVSKVLYAERAESVEAAARVEDRIASAKEALVAGQPELAAQELARAEEDLSSVRPQEGKSELAETQDFLEAKAAETPQGQSTNPGAPLSTQPSRPVPQGARESQAGSESAPSTSEDVSSTGTTGPESGGGPEVAGTPGGDTTDPDTATRPTNDPRRAQVAPENEGTSPTTAPAQPDGNGEGEPEDPRGSTAPSATHEGQPDPTTSPTPPPPPPPPPPADGGAGAAPSTGPSASGAEPPPSSN